MQQWMPADWNDKAGHINRWRHRLDNQRTADKRPDRIRIPEIRQSPEARRLGDWIDAGGLERAIQKIKQGQFFELRDAPSEVRMWRAWARRLAKDLTGQSNEKFLPTGFRERDPTEACQWMRANWRRLEKRLRNGS
jgi:hypothetical protein